jgi:hypothetical protein
MINLKLKGTLEDAADSNKLTPSVKMDVKLKAFTFEEFEKLLEEDDLYVGWGGEDICKAGFEGTFADYLLYSRNYTTTRKICCPLCKSDNVKPLCKDNPWKGGNFPEDYYVCQEDGIMFKEIKK